MVTGGTMHDNRVKLTNGCTGTLQLCGTYLGPSSSPSLPGAANQHARANNLAGRAHNLTVLRAKLGTGPVNLRENQNCKGVWGCLRGVPFLQENAIKIQGN
jgi:hypothetical protein